MAKSKDDLKKDLDKASQDAWDAMKKYREAQKHREEKEKAYNPGDRQSAIDWWRAIQEEDARKLDADEKYKFEQQIHDELAKLP